MQSRDDNPYCSPTSEEGEKAQSELPDARRLPSEVVWASRILGVIWMAYGAMCGVALLLLIFNTNSVTPVAIALALSAMWMYLGSAAYRQELWAIYIGIIVCYASAALSLYEQKPVAIAIVLPSILLAHFVLLKARPLRHTGLPSEASPIYDHANSLHDEHEDL